MMPDETRVLPRHATLLVLNTESGPAGLEMPGWRPTSRRRSGTPMPILNIDPCPLPLFQSSCRVIVFHMATQKKGSCELRDTSPLLHMISSFAPGIRMICSIFVIFFNLSGLHKRRTSRRRRRNRSFRSRPLSPVQSSVVLYFGPQTSQH